MRYLLLLLIFCCLLHSCREQRDLSKMVYEKDVVNMMLGEYNILQQDSLEVKGKHQYIHSKFEQISPDTSSSDLFVLATHTGENDNSVILIREVYQFWWMGEDGGADGAKSWTTFSTIFQIPDNRIIAEVLDDSKVESDIYIWEKHGEGFIAKNRENQIMISLTNDTLKNIRLGTFFKTHLTPDER